MEALEISVLDILLVLAKNKSLIIRTVLVTVVLGVTYALAAPEQFTSTATVARESQENAPQLSGGLGALQQGLGISLGGGGGGLTPAAYPKVLQSREVRLAVVRDTFRFPDAERPMTFVEYVNRPSGMLSKVLDYTIYLPLKLKSMFGRAVEDEASTTPVDSTNALVYPTGAEQNALNSIRHRVTTSINQDNGLMTVQATGGSRQLAAELASSFVRHLRERVRQIRTEQVREQLRFVKLRFEEAQQELVTAEDRLAEFLERNQNPTTPTLQFQRDRLRRQVRFKEQLYSNLQSQLTQARLEVKRQQPVVTVVEQPIPPKYRSAPNRTAIVILSGALGVLFGCIIAFLRSNVRTASFEGEDKEKIRRIKEHLIHGFLNG
jgi:uncharacterized protein involved in exopolysaccharide biosynthesis